MLSCARRQWFWWCWPRSAANPIRDLICRALFWPSFREFFRKVDDLASMMIGMRGHSLNDGEAIVIARRGGIRIRR